MVQSSNPVHRPCMARAESQESTHALLGAAEDVTEFECITHTRHVYHVTIDPGAIDPISVCDSGIALKLPNDWLNER